MNSQYFNRNLLNSMKQTLQSMVSEELVTGPGGYGKAKDPTVQLISTTTSATPAPKAGDATGNLSMGRLTDAERAAQAAQATPAPKAPNPVKYTSFKGPGNYGIMGTPGDFSKLSDAQIENRMRQVKKGGLFQKVADEDQSDEWKAYSAELNKRKNPTPPAPAPAPAPTLRQQSDALTAKQTSHSITPGSMGRSDLPYDPRHNPTGYDEAGPAGKSRAKAAEQNAASTSTSHSITPGAQGRYDLPYHPEHNPSGYNEAGPAGRTRANPSGRRMNPGFNPGF